MNAERLRRAERLVQLRQRAVESAQGALAAAARTLAEAEMLAREAEARWESASALPGTAASSGELAEGDAYRRALRLRADRAAATVAAARDEEARRRRALVEARSALRKIELWRDGMAAMERARLDRKERVATDEVAARIARRDA